MSAMSKSSSSSARDEIDSQTATIGVRSEKRHLTCLLEKFHELRHCEQLIDAQKFQFKMGDSIGLPTKWSFYLQTEKDAIGAYFKLLKKPKNVDAAYGRFKMLIKKANGSNYYHALSNKFGREFKNFAKLDWGIGNILGLKADLTDVVPADGSLTIEVDFELFAEFGLLDGEDLAGKLEAFEVKFLKQLSQDMCRMLTVDGVNANAATKIVSKDNVEFPVHRGVLAARSAVFQRMFQAEMTESTTGVVRMDDLSGKSVNVLLHYLSTGSLHQDWKSPDVIEELTSAAHRYELHLLIAFLDETLGSVCTNENAMRLGVLVRTLGMKKAEMELLEFVKKSATSFEDFMLEPIKMTREISDGEEAE